MRDYMMEYNQKDAPEYVYEVMEEIIKEKKINLDSLFIKRNKRYY